MTQEAYADVHGTAVWVPEKDGGLGRLPPPGKRYLAVTRLAGEDADRSILVFVDGPPDERRATPVRVRFLVRYAPHARLKSGASLGLYKAGVRVATVTLEKGGS